MKYQPSGSWNLIAGVTLALISSHATPLFASDCSFQRTLQVNSTVNLEVTTGSGNIEIRPGASNQLEVCGHVKSSEWFGENVEDQIKRISNNPPILQSGNDIRIGHIDDLALRHNISISYEMVVPAATLLQSHSGSGNQEVRGIRGPVEIDAGSGSIHLSDVGDTVRASTGSGNITVEHVKGNVRARAGSGSIRAEDVAGGFDASTGSGHIVLAQSAPGSVRVNAGSGGIELRGVRGSLEARTGSGSIQAEGAPTGAWTVHTGSGGVHLQLASNASFDLDARTHSGSVDVTPSDSVQGTISRKEVQGKVHGGGVSVDVDTGSGSIEIQ